MIVGISQIALVVRDYDEAKSFYAEVLGFIVFEDTDLGTKRWIRLRAPGGRGSELLLSKAVGDEERRCIGNQAGGRVFLFLLTDQFEADFLTFRAKGVEFLDGPRTESYGKIAVFKDLYGNRIDLIEPIKN